MPVMVSDTRVDKVKSVFIVVNLLVINCCFIIDRVPVKRFIYRNHNSENIFF